MLSCPDRRGVVAAVSGLLAERGCNILDNAQFRDPDNNTFFTRISMVSEEGATKDVLASAFESEVAQKFAMRWHLRDAARRTRVLILVSKHDHCLNDLLYRHGIGALKMDIRGVVSNHRDTYRLTAGHDIPFHHLPVTPEAKARQEARLLEIVDQEKIELVVLARYMQVLTAELCRKLEGQVINIHHSFLPSFKGASPYTRAHARGVKLIGATAHYVTPDLDEGPIIEQEVARVSHDMSVDDFVAAGRDVEAQVLARAVKWHVEHRVLLNGDRTVVFR